MSPVEKTPSCLRNYINRILVSKLRDKTHINFPEHLDLMYNERNILIESMHFSSVEALSCVGL